MIRPKFSSVNDIGGNVMVWQEEQAPCPGCDCLNQHICINCDRSISVNTCTTNNGYCDFCADQKEIK